MSSSPCITRSMLLQESSPEPPSSSPPVFTATATATAGRKPKRPPPITPRRFTRFFTPQNTKSGASEAGIARAGRQLQDITRTGTNRGIAATRTTPRKTVNFADVENLVQTPHSSTRKRKALYPSPETSPVQSSPSKRSRYATPPPNFDILEDAPVFEEPAVFPVPVRRIRSLGGASRTLQRSFGGLLSVGRGFRQDHCTSWQDQTADFYTGSDDVHQLPQGAPPFCTASCNSMSQPFAPNVMSLTYSSQLVAGCRR
jgi:hypothetical protein